VQTQRTEIESLKQEKKTMEESMQTLKTEHQRTAKENHVLRRAVQIQQDRQNETEKELKNAHKYKADTEERIKKLESMIMSLRYRLQAQQMPMSNNFLNERPPDVF
jgi:chromosome segregation ATPase